MKLRVRSRLPQSAFSKQERSRMSRDFARLGYLVTDRPLTGDLIADLVDALEEDVAHKEIGTPPDSLRSEPGEWRRRSSR